MIQRRTLVKAVIAALAPLSMTSAFAAGGPSGAHIGYQHQGQLGAVDMNPYKIAPLTAIIRDAGFTIQNIHVRIVPKANGQEIAYKVTNQKAKTYGGIPVFGLYPDYVNTVEVSYTKVAGDKREEIKESYRIYAPPVYFYATGARDQKNMDMNPEVKKVDPEFKDRLYFINNQILNSWKTGQFTWNNPNDMEHPPTQCVTTKRCTIMGVYQPSRRSMSCQRRIHAMRWIRRSRTPSSASILLRQTAPLQRCLVPMTSWG